MKLQFGIDAPSLVSQLSFYKWTPNELKRIEFYNRRWHDGFTLFFNGLLTRYEFMNIQKRIEKRIAYAINHEKRLI
jgi:hypothetical protein